MMSMGLVSRPHHLHIVQICGLCRTWFHACVLTPFRCTLAWAQGAIVLDGAQSDAHYRQGFCLPLLTPGAWNPSRWSVRGLFLESHGM